MMTNYSSSNKRKYTTVLVVCHIEGGPEEIKQMSFTITWLF